MTKSGSGLALRNVGWRTRLGLGGRQTDRSAEIAEAWRKAGELLDKLEEEPRRVEKAPATVQVAVAPQVPATQTEVATVTSTAEAPQVRATQTEATRARKGEGAGAETHQSVPAGQDDRRIRVDMPLTELFADEEAFAERSPTSSTHAAGRKPGPDVVSAPATLNPKQKRQYFVQREAAKSVEAKREILELVATDLPIGGVERFATVAGTRVGAADLSEYLFDARTTGPAVGGRFSRKKGFRGTYGAPRSTDGSAGSIPQPRGYGQRTPKKIISAALRGALSDRARNGHVHVVSTFTPGDVRSTRAALEIVARAIGNDKMNSKTLVVLHRDENEAWTILRSATNLHVIAVDQLNAYDVLVNEEIVFTVSALSTYVGGPRSHAAPDEA